TVAHARGDEALQRILRRGAQPALARAGIDVAAEPGAETLDVRFGIAGRREDRRLHFQHLAFSEERADQGVEVGAQMQGGESLPALRADPMWVGLQPDTPDPSG